jgi:hypothetical protein
MLPTLKQFLLNSWPRNSYVIFPEFASLYVRKGDLCIRIEEISYRAVGVITIGNVQAKTPGRGAWGRLVKYLVDRDYGIYVENVHNERFAKTLEGSGFIAVNQSHGPNFLFNHEGHLQDW